MNKAYLRALRMIMANPGDAPRKAKSFLKSRVLNPLMRWLPTGRAILPVVVGIHLTLRCNLRCRQCETLLPHCDKAQELSIDEWKRVLDQCASFKPSVYFTGGEPLIVDGIEDLLLYGKSLGLRIHLQTNGVLLTKMADVVADMGIDNVTISLDGPEAIHDEVRRVPGTYYKVVAGIRELVECRRRKNAKTPFVEINCCVLGENASRLLEMVDIAADLGVDHLQFQHTIFNSAALIARHNAIWTEEFVAKNGFDLALPCMSEDGVYEGTMTREIAQDLISTFEAARERARRRGIGLGFLPNIPFSQIPAYYGDLSYPFGQTCGFAWEFMRIMPSGVVEPCFSIRMGRVPEQSVAEVWNSPPYRRFRMLLKKGLWPGCARCCGRQFT